MQRLAIPATVPFLCVEHSSSTCCQEMQRQTNQVFKRTRLQCASRMLARRSSTEPKDTHLIFRVIACSTIGVVRELQCCHTYLQALLKHHHSTSTPEENHHSGSQSVVGGGAGDIGREEVWKTAGDTGREEVARHISS